jgi:hypothetical protein
VSKQDQAGSQLEIKQDLEFQEREWRVERVAWVLGAVLLVLAALGLFGRGGPLSNVVVQYAAGASQLKYERFVRKLAPTLVELRLTETGADPVVWVDRGFVERVEITNVAPQPDHTATNGDQLLLTFAASAPGQPITVQIYFEPQVAGPLSGRAGLVDGESFQFNVFVYP